MDSGPSAQILSSGASQPASRPASQPSQPSQLSQTTDHLVSQLHFLLNIETIEESDTTVHRERSDYSEIITELHVQREPEKLVCGA